MYYNKKIYHRIIAIILAILIAMPTQALAGVADRFSIKKAQAEVRPEIITDSDGTFKLESNPKSSKTEIIIPEKVEKEIPNRQVKKSSNIVSVDAVSTATLISDDKIKNFNIKVESNIDYDLKKINWIITVENLVDTEIKKDDERTLDSTFLINTLSGLSNLKIEKLSDETGKRVGYKKKTSRDNKEDLTFESMGIKTKVPMTLKYNVSADIDNPTRDKTYSLDFDVKVKDNFSFSKRYSINGQGELVRLNMKSSPIQTYNDGEKTIFTDFVLAQSEDDYEYVKGEDEKTKIVLEENLKPKKTDKFEYEIALDDNSKNKDTKITIDVFESTEEGYVKKDRKEQIYVEKAPEKIEIDLKEGQLAKITTETIKKEEIKPELVIEPTPATTTPIIVEEAKPEVVNPTSEIAIEQAPVVAPYIKEKTSPEITLDAPTETTEKAPEIVIEPKKEAKKRPAIVIDENSFKTDVKLEAPKTKLTFDAIEGTKEDRKIELESRREILEAKKAQLETEKQKAKTNIILDTKDTAEKPVFKLDKTNPNILEEIESVEITEKDLDRVIEELEIEKGADLSAREILTSSIEDGKVNSDELEIALRELILRKELSTEEIQLAIDELSNEYDLNKSELKEVLRLVADKVENKNEVIIETLSENGVAVDTLEADDAPTQKEVIELLKENGKSDAEAKEIAIGLFEKTGYELNPEKILRDKLASGELTAEELQSRIDEIVQEYGIDKTEVERILDSLNIEEDKKEELAKDIIELSENDEEISLNILKSRLNNIIEKFNLTDDQKVEILSKLEGNTKGEVLASLDEILPTYGFGEEDIERIKTNIFAEAESYELMASLRAIVSEYAITEDQVNDLINKIFENPNLTEEELREKIAKELPNYGFGDLDITEITLKLLDKKRYDLLDKFKRIIEVYQVTPEQVKEIAVTVFKDEADFDALKNKIKEVLPGYNFGEEHINIIIEETFKDEADFVTPVERLKELLESGKITKENLEVILNELKDKYNLSEDQINLIIDKNRINIEKSIEKDTLDLLLMSLFLEVDSGIELGEDLNGSPVGSGNHDYANKTFIINAPISVKASPTWAIPAGWWFDVYIGEYLYPGKYELKSLTDPDNPNVVVAVPQYIPNQNKIRYTFPRKVNLTKNLQINQELQFRTENIPQGASSINVDVKVAPKNNPVQSAPTVKVDAYGLTEIPLNYTVEFAGEQSIKEGATIPANAHNEDKDWSLEEGLKALDPQYQVGIDGYGNPVQVGNQIKEIEWTVTYLSHKSLTNQGLLASLTAVEGSGIDTNAIRGVTINGKPVDLEDNPAKGSHGINDSRYTEFKDDQGRYKYEIKFKTPVTKNQDYYTLDFYGRLNNVYDSTLPDKPHGSARLAVPGYIDAQEVKGNPNAAYADNRETITGEYTSLGTDGKPTQARWIVTEHVTTKHGGSNPFKAHELENQDLESLKVSFYQPDAQGKLIQIGVTEEHKDDYPLAASSLLQNPPVGTIVVYEYTTKLKGDPYQTKYSLDNVTLGDFNKTYTVVKEWQGIDSTTKIPAIDVTLTGSDGIAKATGRLTGNIDKNRRETTTIDVPKWGISQNNDGTLNYNNITYKATEEKVSTFINNTNFTNVSNHVVEEKNEVELINQIIQDATPGKLSVKLLDSNSKEPLDNVEFTLRSPDFDKIARTDANGIISFDDLPAGPYTLVQNDNKVAYKKPLINGHIEVKSDGKVSWNNNELIATPYNFDEKNPTLTVYNDKLPPAEFSFKKVDGNKNGLSEAKFVLKDTKGNIVETIYSGSNGKVEFTNISPGKYTLEEVAAPDGYTNLGISYEVSIDEGNYIEITNGNKVIASGYPGNMIGGEAGATGQTNVTVNRNGFSLREFGQAGGRAGVLDRLKFETLTYNLNMNVQNPKATDTFAIRLDTNLDVERNIAGKFPNIYDNNGRLVAEYTGFDEKTNSINFKFDPGYVADYHDINIKYEIIGIRPDDFKVLNKYGEGGISGHPAAKKWDFKSYVDYNGKNVKTDNYNIEIDEASGDYHYPVYAADQMGSHIVDIKRNPTTRKPESIKAVFYFNPIPNTNSKDFDITADFKFQTQAGNKSHNMSFEEMLADPYPTRGYDFKEARVYRVDNSEKYDLMPTSYGVDENKLGTPFKTFKEAKTTNNKKTQELRITGLNNTNQDGWVVVMDFDVTVPDVIDENFITLIMKQNDRMQRGFIMKPGKLNASASATTNQGPIRESFSFEVPNESYKEGRFELIKYISGTTTPLAGATFSLYDKATGRIVQRQTTPEDGKLIFENLKPGRYTLEETSPPAGYQKSENERWDITVDNAGKTTVIKDNIVLSVYNGDIQASITNNANPNALSNKGEATTTVEELGNNRFKISTTLSGYSQYQEAVGEDNKVSTSGPTRSYAGEEAWHWLEMENYAKASYQGDSPKAEFYLLLNSKADLGDINQHTHLDLKGTNVRIDSVEMRGLGNNNDSNGKEHITNFKNGYAESVFASSSRTAFAPHTYTVTRPVNEKYKQQINIPKERFGHMKEGDEGHWMFIVKVTATVEDPSKASSLDAKWIYDVDEYQDRNISENTMNLDALGDAYKPAGYRNTLKGQLVHTIGNGFKLVADSSDTFNVDQGNGTVTKTSIVEFTGNGEGSYNPLSNLSFKFDDGTAVDVSSNRLPIVNIKKVTNKNTSIKVENSSNKINFVKYGVEGTSSEKLDGVKFQLQRDGRDYGNVKTSSLSDSISYENLPDGNYTLMEVIPADKIDKERSKDGVIVYKLGDKYYKAPANRVVASFKVVDGKISEINSWKVDANSKTYSMMPTNSTIDVMIDNEVTDKPTNGQFKIVKVSNSEVDPNNPNEKKRIKGVKFTLTGPDTSTKTVEVTTDENGEALFKDLEFGTYTLAETKEAKGYKKSDKTWTVKLFSDGSVYIKENQIVSRGAVPPMLDLEVESGAPIILDDIGVDDDSTSFDGLEISDGIYSNRVMSSGWEKVDPSLSSNRTYKKDLAGEGKANADTRITEINKSNNRFKQEFLYKQHPDGYEIRHIEFHSYPEVTNLNLKDFNINVYNVDNSSTLDNITGKQKITNLKFKEDIANNYNRIKVSNNPKISKAILIEIEAPYDDNKSIGLGSDYYSVNSNRNIKSWVLDSYTTEADINSKKPAPKPEPIPLPVNPKWEKVDEQRSTGRENPGHLLPNDEASVQTNITEIDKTNKRFKQIFLYDQNPNGDKNRYMEIHSQPEKFNVNTSNSNVKVYQVGSDINGNIAYNDITNIVNVSSGNVNGKDRLKISVPSNYRGQILVEVDTNYDPSTGIGLGTDYYSDVNSGKKSWLAMSYPSENNIATKPIQVITYEEGYEDTAIPVIDDPNIYNDPNLEEGKERIEEGSEGTLRTYYKYRLVNGERDGSRQYLDEKVIEPMVPNRKYIGTKKKEPVSRTDFKDYTNTTDYQVITTEDPNLAPGEVIVDKEGSQGETITRYTITYKTEGTEATIPSNWPSDFNPSRNPGEVVTNYSSEVIKDTPAVNKEIRVGSQLDGFTLLKDNTTVIENTPKEKGSYPFTGGPGENILFLTVGAIVMVFGALYYNNKRRKSY